MRDKVEGIEDRNAGRLYPAGVRSRKSHQHICVLERSLWPSTEKRFEGDKNEELGPLPQNSQNAKNNDEIVKGTLYITDTVPGIYTY